MTDTGSILFNIEAGIAHITLNRPDVGNAMNFELVKALAHAALACANDPTVKVVLISANGRMFCAGIESVLLKKCPYHFAKKLPKYRYQINLGQRCCETPIRS